MLLRECASEIGVASLAAKVVGKEIRNSHPLLFQRLDDHQLDRPRLRQPEHAKAKAPEHVNPKLPARFLRAMAFLRQNLHLVGTFLLIP